MLTILIPLFVFYYY